MRFDKALVAAVLIKRYKRFLADVKLDTGEEVTVHCANTGAMTGCATPGSRIWLSKSDNPKRKYCYSWELVELPNEQGYICVNTARANQVIGCALERAAIPELSVYKNIKREVKYGDSSRVDFLLTTDNLPDLYLEVKSVTLHLQDDLGAFPDAVTLRGQKHLVELAAMKKSGARAVLLFCVMHNAINKVSVANSIDPKYGQLLTQVMQSGVEVYCYSVAIDLDGMQVAERIPLALNDR